MSPWDLIPLMLLLLFSLALTIGTGVVLFVLSHSHRRRHNEQQVKRSGPASTTSQSALRHWFIRRPPSWLAVKSRNLLAVQSALGLNNPKSCSCLSGLAGEEKLFITPPVKGWVLVVGDGLPDPSEDVDICFRFLMKVSRKLGEVQFFSASPILHHHAWVRAERGRVIRAYAWAGRTLWKQGRRTTAERELAVRCFDYNEVSEPNGFGPPDDVALNVDKVPQLAARWSLDPACLDESFLEREHGIAGEPSRRF